MKIFIDQNSDLTKYSWEKDIRKREPQRYEHSIACEVEIVYGANRVKIVSEDQDQTKFIEADPEYDNNLLEELAAQNIITPRRSDFNQHYESGNGNIDIYQFSDFMPQDQHYDINSFKPIEFDRNKYYNDYQYEPRELFVEPNRYVAFKDTPNNYTIRTTLQKEAGIDWLDNNTLMYNKNYPSSGWTYSYDSSQGIDSIVYGGKYIKNK
jgi:hypothetical protein